MTHAEAEARSRELNLELGARGDDESFYIAVEREPGEWDVEKRTEKKSWRQRIVDALPEMPS